MDITALAIPLLSFGAVATAVFAVAKAPAGAASLARRLGGYRGVDADVGEKAGAAVDAASRQLLREQKYSNWSVLDQMISGRSWADREAADLVRADVPLRVGEFLLLRGVCAAVIALVGYVLVGNVLGAAAGGIGYLLPRMWVKRRQASRRKKFEEQLVEALSLLASSLRSGYSFLQGMEAVSRELPAPVAEEFSRLIQELGVGASADTAFVRLLDRVRSEDLELVVTAIMIQRTVGGELAGILETIVKTVRERQKIKRDIRTLTAQQRWSGYIIGALPVVVMVMVWLGNRAYVNELLYTPQGNVMLGIACVLEVSGFFMIKRIMNIEV